MIKNILRALLLMVALTGPGCFSAFAQQTGKIIGTVTDVDTKEPVPFANVKFYSGGALKGGAICDINGAFSGSPLSPGVYTMEVSSAGYKKHVVPGINVGAEDIKRINSAIVSVVSTTKEVEVKAYKEPIIGISGGEKQRLNSDQIAKIPTRNPQDMVATFSNVTSADYGKGLNVRGNRTGDNAVFVNGVRQFGTSLPPAESIQELSLITGGIPAQYGDALGGIISVTTKSAARKFNVGVQGETSSLFDKYNYNFVGLNGSGPLVTQTTIEGPDTTTRTILGFFGAVQYTSNSDGAPSAIPIYKAKASTLEALRA
ncbi:MAG TPA: TonB-dependent receptor, partial [Catalimonadaceae bacterium]|nr:TonB-dependent receptor [Catalimonadaceae bacterium]